MNFHQELLSLVAVDSLSSLFMASSRAAAWMPIFSSSAFRSLNSASLKTHRGETRSSIAPWAYTPPEFLVLSSAFGFGFLRRSIFQKDTILFAWEYRIVKYSELWHQASFTLKWAAWIVQTMPQHEHSSLYKPGMNEHHGPHSDIQQVRTQLKYT